MFVCIFKYNINCQVTLFAFFIGETGHTDVWFKIITKLLAVKTILAKCYIVWTYLKPIIKLLINNDQYIDIYCMFVKKWYFKLFIWYIFYNHLFH